MSNILEALRKAQDEKSRAVDQTITGREALIAHRTTRSGAGTNKRVIWLGCSGVALLAVVGWLLYGSSKPASPKKSTMTASAPAVATAPSSLPPPPVVQVPAAVPAQPQPDDNEERSPRRKNRLTQSRSIPVPTAASDQATSQHSTETTVSGSPEGIKLTGIAWQDSRKMRRAVINDVLVGEGAVVAGTKVLEIRPGLVRFEKNGTIFEAVLPR